MEVGQYPAAPPPGSSGLAAHPPASTSSAAAPAIRAPIPSSLSSVPTVVDADVESNATTMPPRRGAAFIPGFRSRPPIRTFIRENWLDILTPILCALASLLIYLLVPPILPRYFPLYPGIETSAWGRRYGQPLRREYITTLTSALVSYLIPAAIMGAIALWSTRDFRDGNAALIGLGYALATAALFTSIIKVFIGGLRPHFLNVCRPSIPGELTFYQASRLCGDSRAMREAQMSFPSGHAVAAFAGFGFLALYINAKFKVFGHGRRSGLRDNAAAADTILDRNITPTAPGTGPGAPAAVKEKRSTAAAAAAAAAIPDTSISDSTVSKTGRIQHWKLILFSLPWLIATVLALSKHHPIDVIVGALIGTAFAHMAYRMVYRSVYDERSNHIPQESHEGAFKR
ncbi:hypothetical protein IAQ61_005369, partial [Plenodomus lingam]|uniref:uncharacterized protein n=1 Tax=Leptosphaeria maculans TaxID=5022 RepID=UPI003317FBA2